MLGFDLVPRFECDEILGKGTEKMGFHDDFSPHS